MPLPALREFLKLESASGILLVIAGACAMVIANSPLLDLYQALLQTPIKVQVGNVLFDKTLLIWINDLLMAIFFLLVGLEIKREVVAGELSRPGQGGAARHRGARRHDRAGCDLRLRSTGTTRSACAAGRSRPPPTSPSRSACCRCSASACPSGSRSS